MDVPGIETPRRAVRPERYDAVVVGAGPYGLSAAAHLRGLGLKVAVFGKTMELWREHMPRGMRLRSQSRATNLSDPGRRYTFRRFLEESGARLRYPFPLDTFIDYARWFQRQAVPDVDETYVRSIESLGRRFLLTLEDGRRLDSDAVVMAIGVLPYAYRPKEFSGLGPGLVSHSSDLREPAQFRDRRVAVIGAGQSAVECAALLRENGATVDLVSRHPIVWLEPDRSGERTIVENLLAPDTGLGPGWGNWILEHAPFLFYHLPASRKGRALAHYSGAWASDWLKPRIHGRVILHEGESVVSCDRSGEAVALVLSSGSRILADHVILATGYRVDLDRLSMLAPALRGAIATEAGSPTLGPSFESSVPGLYFIGATAMRSFGPIFRFVLGCRTAAPRVARAVKRRQRATAEKRAVLHVEPNRDRLAEAPHPRRPADEGPDT